MDGPYLLITSLQNEQVKNLVKLRKRRERDRQQLAIIEESLVIGRALDAGYPLRTTYFCLEQLDDQGRAVLDRIRGTEAADLVQLSPQVMAKVSYREKPDGLLVTAPQVAASLNDLALTSPALLVVLEGVEKPGNLGAVLRVADGAGAHAVLVCGRGTDLFNPNVLRSSRGASFAVPTVAAETAEILDFLHRQGIAAVAASPAADHDYAAADLTGPVALVLGTEHEGLTPELLAACDRSVSIPMAGMGDSLNVATSCAILLYEAARQRRPNEG